MNYLTSFFSENSVLLPVLIGSAVFVLIALMAYAWHLQGRLRALEQKQLKDARETEARRQQHIHDASQGVRILAGAMIREEVTLTEGCMRIAYLLTQVDEASKDKQAYSVFFQLASATAHIPVLDAWKRLPKQQKVAYTKERTLIEGAFQEFVIDAAQGLLSDPLLGNQRDPLWYKAD